VEETPQRPPWWGPDGPAEPGRDHPPGSGWQPPAPEAGWGGAPQAPGWGQQSGGPAPIRYKPGIIPLRPITLGEIYDGAFQAMRGNPRTMIGISAAVISVTTLLSLIPLTAGVISLIRISQTPTDPAVAPTAGDLAAVGTGLVGTLAAAAVQWLGVTILTGLLIIAVSEAVLDRRISAGELWRRAKGRIWALLGLAVLTGLATVLGFLLLVVPGLLIFVGWSMAAPALLLEGQGVAGAIRRSWALTRGSFWRVFGILVLTAIIVGIASAVIVVPLGLVSLLVGLGLGGGSSTGVLVAQQIVQQVGSAVAGSIFYPFQAAVSALLYIDLRMRREGLDVELLRAAEGASG
jgi:Membrane domain of glycerophosphoryl diester phosphodiesterase